MAAEARLALEPCTWLALSVAEVDEAHLVGDINGRLDTSHLPIVQVSLPVVDPSTVAVLSWRWDTHHHGQISRNIVSSVRHAKSRDIKYLMIDVIAIDQRLRSAELLQQVLAFSELYKAVHVIAAYDDTEEPHFQSSVYRPWIASEALLYRHNPFRVTYISHTAGQGNDQFFTILGNLWTQSFAPIILSVLFGEVGMADISDFRLILPVYADILDAAYQRMGKNDYLLTAALLVQARSSHAFFSVRGIELLDFEYYDWERDGNGYHISLGGTKVCFWEHDSAADGPSLSLWFQAISGVERVIYHVLEKTDSEYAALMRCVALAPNQFFLNETSTDFNLKQEYENAYRAEIVTVTLD